MLCTLHVFLLMYFLTFVKLFMEKENNIKFFFFLLNLFDLLEFTLRLEFL